MGRRGAVWLAWGVSAAAVMIVALTWLLHVVVLHARLLRCCLA
jgi:hypothetical protein